jgi:hemolysin type calcium-binding protein
VKRTRLFAAAGAAAAVLASALVWSQSAQAAHRAVTCDGHAATIVGSSGNDHLIGTTGRDVIAGLGGDDVILGLGGNDIICGGNGNDVLNAMGGAGHVLFGGPGNDLCVGPAAASHDCESPQRPDPLQSDPPTGGGPNTGSVARAQSAPESASCSVANGVIKLVLKGKVSPFYNHAADILVEPIIFKYHSATKSWSENPLAGVHTIKLGAYNGTWHNFLVRNTDHEPVKGIYYVGYYIQWYPPNSQSSAGYRGTFVGNYPKTLRGAVHNVGLCLPNV